MRIALSMRIIEAPGTAELRDAISHDWLARLAAWDMTPVPVPNIVAQPEAYLDGRGVDLLVLTGGADLGVTPERDAPESPPPAYPAPVTLPSPTRPNILRKGRERG